MRFFTRTQTVGYVSIAMSAIILSPIAKAEDVVKGEAKPKGEVEVSKAPLTKIEKDGQGYEKVKAPFTKVQKDADGNETVKAPFVKVKHDANGNRTVKAPFTKIEHIDGKVHIRAPFVNKWMTEAEWQAKQDEDARREKEHDEEEARKKTAEAEEDRKEKERDAKDKD